MFLALNFHLNFAFEKYLNRMQRYFAFFFNLVKNYRSLLKVKVHFYVVSKV